MLPIDDAAKSGDELALIHVARFGISALWLGSWEDDGFYTSEGHKVFPTHYVPMPWLMHAGAMREALHKVAMTSTDPNLEAEAISIMCATEWPKKEG